MFQTPYKSYNSAMDNSQRIVTIKDIAQELKLSVSTVSRALRDSAEIKLETKMLVKEVAARLHYTPNPIALSLKEKRSKIIGVIVPEIANNFSSNCIAGIEDIAYKKGYHVLIFQSHEKYEREKENVQLLVSRRIDGLIISLANETQCYDHLTDTIDKNIPLVMFDRVCHSINSHKVITNDYFGAYNGVEHLIQQGYHNIALITLPLNLSITQNRLNGYKDALKKYNLPVHDEWIIHSPIDVVCSEMTIRKILESDNRPDAIFISAERLNITCIKVIKEMGLRIPEDIALAGFSDNPITPYLAPALTAVKQPTFNVGQKAAELIIELIENNNTTRQYRTIQLDTALDIQSSSRRRV